MNDIMRNSKVILDLTLLVNETMNNKLQTELLKVDSSIC